MYLETVTNQIFAALSNLQNPVAISTKIGLYLDKIHPARGQACMYLMNVTSNTSNSTSIRIEYMYIYISIQSFKLFMIDLIMYVFTSLKVLKSNNLFL